MIIKRNGQKVKFDKQRIIKAIRRAGQVPLEKCDYIASQIELWVESRDEEDTAVEEIQDKVIQMLSHEFRSVAHDYSEFRKKRSALREADKEALTFLEDKNDYLKYENSNKNPSLVTIQRDYIAGIVNRRLAESILPDHILQHHNDGAIHIHDLDYFAQSLYSGMHNCCLVNLDDMLQNGTVLNGVAIHKPHSLLVAMNLATQIALGVSSSQYGGQTHNLYHMSKFVDVSRRRIRKDVRKEFSLNRLEYRKKNDPAVERVVRVRLAYEIKQSVQVYQYQLVSMMAVNGQAPFLSLVINLLEAAPGRDREDLALLAAEVLRQRTEGLPNEDGVPVTNAFPKIIYVLSELNDNEDSEYWWLTKLAAACTARRMTPDYVSARKLRVLKRPTWDFKRARDGEWQFSSLNPLQALDLSDHECEILQEYYSHDNDQDPELSALLKKVVPGSHNRTLSDCLEAAILSVAPMGCRNFLPSNVPQYYGRFNLGVVTLNLPYIALQTQVSCNKNSIIGHDRDAMIDGFFVNLDHYLKDVYDIGMIRANALANTSSDHSPLMFQNGVLAHLKKGETLEKLIFSGYATVTIGYVGLYETVKILDGGNHWVQGTTAHNLGMRILHHLNDYADKWTEETGVKWGLYGTPEESVTYKFAKALKKFPVIPTVNDKDYVMNSYHIPVWLGKDEGVNAFDKILWESPFQDLTTGGAITYIECPDLTGNVDVVLEIIKYISNVALYAELNTKSDYCHRCRVYDHIELIDDGKKFGYRCKNCGNEDPSEMNVARRVCGYISTTLPNRGRLNDIKDRKEHI